LSCFSDHPALFLLCFARCRTWVIIL
jgi:hypothetical protein